MKISLLNINKESNYFDRLRKTINESNVLTPDELIEGIELYTLTIALDEKKNILGYILYSPYEKLNLGTVLDDLYEPDNFDIYEKLLKTKYSNGIYLKGLEVFDKHKYQGIGSLLFEEILKLNVPILLYSLSDSLSYWHEKGFSMFEEGGYWDMLIP